MLLRCLGESVAPVYELYSLWHGKTQIYIKCVLLHYISAGGACYGMRNISAIWTPPGCSVARKICPAMVEAVAISTCMSVPMKPLAQYPRKASTKLLRSSKLFLIVRADSQALMKTMSLGDAHLYRLSSMIDESSGTSCWSRCCPERP